MKNKGRNTFIVSYDWQDFFDTLTKPTEKVKLINAMFAFAKKDTEKLTHTEKAMDKDTAMAWIAIKRSMSYHEEDYNEKCARNRENARLGGQAKARNSVANATERYQTLPNASERCRTVANAALYDNDTDNDKKENIYTKEKSERYNQEQLLSENFADREVASKFADFLAMRANLRNNKEVTTVETFEALVAQLRELATNKEEAIKVLNNSIRNNLTDLYPLKKENTSKTDEVKYAN